MSAPRREPTWLLLLGVVAECVVPARLLRKLGDRLAEASRHGGVA